MSLTFQVDLDPAETVRASRAIGRRTFAGRYGSFIWSAIAFAPVGLGIAMGVRPAVFLPYFGILLLVSISALALPAVQRWQVRRTYASTPSLQGPQTYKFTEQGLELSNAVARSTIAWDAIVEIAETEEFFLFYYSRKCAYYLPKRVVALADTEAALRDCLDRHHGSSGLGTRTSESASQPT